MKRKVKKEKSIILRVCILIGCAYFSVTLLSLYMELNEKRSDLAELEKEQSQIQNDVDELRAILDSESDTKLIEKAARERLGYIYSNEQVFIDYSGS